MKLIYYEIGSFEVDDFREDVSHCAIAHPEWFPNVTLMVFDSIEINNPGLSRLRVKCKYAAEYIRHRDLIKKQFAVGDPERNRQITSLKDTYPDWFTKPGRQRDQQIKHLCVRTNNGCDADVKFYIEQRRDGVEYPEPRMPLAPEHAEEEDTCMPLATEQQQAPPKKRKRADNMFAVGNGAAKTPPNRIKRETVTPDLGSTASASAGTHAVGNADAIAGEGLGRTAPGSAGTDAVGNTDGLAGEGGEEPGEGGSSNSSDTPVGSSPPLARNGLATHAASAPNPCKLGTAPNPFAVGNKYKEVVKALFEWLGEAFTTFPVAIENAVLAGLAHRAVGEAIVLASRIRRLHELPGPAGDVAGVLLHITLEDIRATVDQNPAALPGFRWVPATDEEKAIQRLMGFIAAAVGARKLKILTGLVLSSY